VRADPDTLIAITGRLEFVRAATILSISSRVREPRCGAGATRLRVSISSTCSDNQTIRATAAFDNS